MNKAFFLLLLILLGCSVKNNPVIDNSPKPLIYGTLIDVDGNTYKTIVIGSQTWLAENLRTTKYNDGSSIPNVTNNTTWSGLTTGAYCWYNNDAITYKAGYGALYNWYAVNTSKLCPVGWHVPSDAEWATLINYLGVGAIDGKPRETASAKLREKGTIHWESPNIGATNESGFTALPGGYRDGYNSTFKDIVTLGIWLSSTDSESLNCLLLRYDDSDASRGYNDNDVGRGSGIKKDGFSVRCIKN